MLRRDSIEWYVPGKQQDGHRGTLELRADSTVRPWAKDQLTGAMVVPLCLAVESGGTFLGEASKGTTIAQRCSRFTLVLRAPDADSFRAWHDAISGVIARLATAKGMRISPESSASAPAAAKEAWRAEKERQLLEASTKAKADKAAANAEANTRAAAMSMERVKFENTVFARSDQRKERARAVAGVRIRAAVRRGIASALETARRAEAEARSPAVGGYVAQRAEAAPAPRLNGEQEGGWCHGLSEALRKCCAPQSGRKRPDVLL